MTKGRLGESCKAFTARLAHDIHGDALSLHLHLRVALIGWLSQGQTSGLASDLVEFRIGKIRHVDGILIHGCLNTRTTIGGYNRVRMKDVKRDLRAWFSAIASRRIHAESRLVILVA